MKLLKILSHPFIQVLSFCILLISGESYGGLYLTYILMALPHGSLYAVLAVVGIILCLLAGIKKFHAFLSATFNIAGSLFMTTSVYWFFASDHTDYNIATFQQPVPLLSFCIFAVVIVCSIVFRLMTVMKLLSPGKNG